MAASSPGHALYCRFIDVIHIKVRRDTVQNEAYYVILGITPERRREVLGIVNFPSESAGGWKIAMEALRQLRVAGSR